MRAAVFTLFVVFVSCVGGAIAQAPPAVSWQHCYGGYNSDVINALQPLADGGFVLAGQTASSDGDIVDSRGATDVWIARVDSKGTIIWQQNYGGSHNDAAVDIQLTPDGGYVFLAITSSSDGDVLGYRGGDDDIWLVKLDAVGQIQWQRCLGGPGREIGHSLRATPDGGYVIGGYVTADGGDVSGHHGTNNANDVWVVKTDANGVIEWQHCYGGNGSDDLTTVIPDSGGGYIFSATVESVDGDVNCSHYANEDVWLVKLDATGQIEWQNCAGGDAGEVAAGLLQTTDGGYVIAGIEYSDDLPGTHGLGGDGWVVKFDAAGQLSWQRCLGGSDMDRLQAIMETPDGFIVAGSTQSNNGDVCTNKGSGDLFLLKLNSDGTTAWKNTYGGSSDDAANALCFSSDGGIVAGGFSSSNDGDVSGNHNPRVADAWLVKLSFPGIAILPTIVIDADDTVICPGKPVNFHSVITNGGNAPVYAWAVNGVAVAGDSGAIAIAGLKDGDVVRCQLTSNSNCVTSPFGMSNSIGISVDGSLTPANFLPSSLQICSYGNLTLQATGSYETYQWSTGAQTPSIVVNQPGTYWLGVTANGGCPGRDSVVVTPKTCLTGFYMPSAFTPNHDGKNDLFKPVIGGVALQYKLTIYNRWGQVVFSSGDPAKGWDGSKSGSPLDPQVFVWVCSYQLQGDLLKTESGTVSLIR